MFSRTCNKKLSRLSIIPIFQYFIKQDDLIYILCLVHSSTCSTRPGKRLVLFSLFLSFSLSLPLSHKKKLLYVLEIWIPNRLGLMAFLPTLYLSLSLSLPLFLSLSLPLSFLPLPKKHPKYLKSVFLNVNRIVKGQLPLSLSAPLCLSVCLFICLSICL